MKSIRSSMLFKAVILAIGALGMRPVPPRRNQPPESSLLPTKPAGAMCFCPPGVYSFALQSPSLPAPIMVGKTGSAQIAIVLPAVVSTEKARRRQPAGADPQRWLENRL